MGIIDTAMVPARLDVAGFTMDEAAALFGQMTQKAQTLVNVPLTLSTALAASLVPAISEAIALRDRREVQELSLIHICIKAQLESNAAQAAFLEHYNQLKEKIEVKAYPKKL